MSFDSVVTSRSSYHFLFKKMSKANTCFCKRAGLRVYLGHDGGCKAYVSSKFLCVKEKKEFELKMNIMNMHNDLGSPSLIQPI